MAVDPEGPLDVDSPEQGTQSEEFSAVPASTVKTFPLAAAGEVLPGSLLAGTSQTPD